MDTRLIEILYALTQRRDLALLQALAQRLDEIGDSRCLAVRGILSNLIWYVGHGVFMDALDDITHKTVLDLFIDELGPAQPEIKQETWRDRPPLL